MNIFALIFIIFILLYFISVPFKRKRNLKRYFSVQESQIFSSYGQELINQLKQYRQNDFSFLEEKHKRTNKNLLLSSKYNISELNATLLAYVERCCPHNKRKIIDLDIPENNRVEYLINTLLRMFGINNEVNAIIDAISNDFFNSEDIEKKSRELKISMISEHCEKSKTFIVLLNIDKIKYTSGEILLLFKSSTQILATSTEEEEIVTILENDPRYKSFRFILPPLDYFSYMNINADLYKSKEILTYNEQIHNSFILSGGKLDNINRINGYCDDELSIVDYYKDIYLEQYSRIVNEFAENEKRLLCRIMILPFSISKYDFKEFCTQLGLEFKKVEKKFLRHEVIYKSEPYNFYNFKTEFENGDKLTSFSRWFNETIKYEDAYEKCELGKILDKKSFQIIRIINSFIEQLWLKKSICSLEQLIQSVSNMYERAYGQVYLDLVDMLCKMAYRSYLEKKMIKIGYTNYDDAPYLSLELVRYSIMNRFKNSSGYYMNCFLKTLFVHSNVLEYMDMEIQKILFFYKHKFEINKNYSNYLEWNVLSNYYISKSVRCGDMIIIEKPSSIEMYSPIKNRRETFDFNPYQQETILNFLIEECQVFTRSYEMTALYE